ncbi:MAG TPA: hypothetical protein VJN18_00710 [Polyangiaceae bacterium]|nr:hypothetical protein [Polyangiaceae bacterium]
MTPQSALLTRLGEVLRSVAQREISSRFQQLTPDEVIGSVAKAAV